MEVLVSIVVLSFGLLGMVGMQAAALQSNREAKLQASAARYARELAEMMRGNRETGIRRAEADNPYLGDFRAPTGSTTTASSQLTAIRNTTANCYTNANGQRCEVPRNVAEWEIREWLARLNAELPGARVRVCFDSAPFDPASGLPRWACNNTGEIAMIKIGWTRRSTDPTRPDDPSDPNDGPFERATLPSVVVPVTPGSTT